MVNYREPQKPKKWKVQLENFSMENGIAVEQKIMSVRKMPGGPATGAIITSQIAAVCFCVYKSPFRRKQKLCSC